MMRADGSDVRHLTNRAPSDFAASVLEQGVDAAFSRLAYSIRANPNARYCTNTEGRYLARRLAEESNLKGARRIAEWNLMNHPGFASAGDMLILVNRAAGMETPAMASVDIITKFRAGQPDHAWAVYRESLTVMPATLPREHPAIAHLLRAIGRVLIDSGNDAEAQGLLREALDIQRVALGDEHPETAITRCLLGSCLIELKQYDEAESLLVAAHGTLRRVLAAEHRRTRAAEHALADLRAARESLMSLGE